MTADRRLYVDSEFLSPYAMAAFVALSEKAAAFEVVTVDLEQGAQHAAGYAGLSLTAKVPLLVEGEFVLSESSAICEYVDETFEGTPLYPRAPRERARARQVQAWLRSDLMPIRQERSSEGVFRPRAGAVAPLSPAARDAAQKLCAAAGHWLDGGRLSLFAAWSIADLDLAMMLNRLVLAGDPVPQPLADYARAQWQRPSVRLWLERAQ